KVSAQATVGLPLAANADTASRSSCARARVIPGSPILATRPTTRGSPPASYSARSVGRNRGLPRLRSLATGSSGSCSISGCDRSSSSSNGLEARDSDAIAPTYAAASTRPAPCGVGLQPLDGFVEDVVPLAEGEPHERSAHVGGVTEDCRRDADDTGIVRQRADEGLAVVDAQRAHVALDEIGRLWAMHGETDVGK